MNEPTDGDQTLALTAEVMRLVDEEWKFHGALAALLNTAGIYADHGDPVKKLLKEQALDVAKAWHDMCERRGLLARSVGVSPETELWTRPNASSGEFNKLRRKGITFRGADRD